MIFSVLVTLKDNLLCLSPSVKDSEPKPNLKSSTPVNKQQIKHATGT